jgi:serine phosphatase RsbU (regulator of sigma subunit)/CRP-like cAMP-binding protein
MSPRPDTASRQRLRYNVLLETLSDGEFEELEPHLARRAFAPGEIIIEDETHGEEVYFLVEGRVRIVKVNQEGKEHLLAVLHAGDCFGELELIAGRPRSARVIAVEQSVAYALPRPDFERLLARSATFSTRLLQVLSIRVRALNYHFIREANRKLDRDRTELRRLEQLIEAARKVNSTLNLEELLDIILSMALQMVDGDRGTLYLVDEQAGELWTKVSKELSGAGSITVRLPLGKGIAGYVAVTGDVINIPDAYLDPRFNPDFDRRTGFRTESILCVPMRNKDGRIIGVFQLLNKRKGTFTDEDARFIDALSVHASLAIENARLYAQEREKIRIERDLLAARQVQMNLLPKAFPLVPAYDFAAATVPAREVAGDLYDFVELEGGDIAFCLGDVSGKGLPAALMMAGFQATVRDQVRLAQGPADCVARTNRLVARTAVHEKFVTLFLGILSPSSHEVRYTNAGHDHPFLLSASGVQERLDRGGVIVGILEEFPFEEGVARMEPGDVLLVYSDGIAEATSGGGEQFGEQRIRQALEQVRDRPAEEVCDAVLRAVRAHTGDAPPVDDMTLVVIRRR